MTESEAIDIIARTVIAARAASIEDDWENYPEIGEGDWMEIVQRADELRLYPTDDEYREAYALLSARATVEEAP